ncbi:MAG: MBL fold metallo-hydrolase [Pseudothermotoga sp.]
MELIWLSDRFGVLHDRTNLGLIRFSKDVMLIDSGIDESYARKALRIISENGLKLRWLVNTHFHADHIGGNAFIQRKLQVQTMAHPLTKSFVENPILEPMSLYCGANPPDELKSKLFLAQPSEVDVIVENGSHFEDAQIIELPGHASGQIGLALKDLIFAADSVFGIEILGKKGIVVYSDIGAALESLEKLRGFDHCIPSHGSINDKDLVQLNKLHIEFVAEKIHSLLTEPMSEEDLVSQLIENLQIDLQDVGIYYLLRMTVLAYLSWLKKSDKVQLCVDKGKPIWQSL